jgi:hypothetical protein
MRRAGRKLRRLEWRMARDGLSTRAEWRRLRRWRRILERAPKADRDRALRRGYPRSGAAWPCEGRRYA